jgi:hypothetical protein
MSRKRTELDHILTYAQTAPLEEAAAGLEAYRIVVRNRQVESVPTPIMKRGWRRPRKAEPEADHAEV